MERDITHVLTDFRVLSSAVYHRIENDFGRFVEKLHRRSNENVFQQAQARFSNELKNLLEDEVKKLLEKHRSHSQLINLQQQLASHVTYLVTSFREKARFM